MSCGHRLIENPYATHCGETIAHTPWPRRLAESVAAERDGGIADIPVKTEVVLCRHCGGHWTLYKDILNVNDLRKRLGEMSEFLEGRLEVLADEVGVVPGPPKGEHPRADPPNHTPLRELVALLRYAERTL